MLLSILFDILGGTPAPNAFDMMGMNDSLPTTDNSQRSKTAEDFLGANANLVNLDNLVSKPAPVGPGPSKSILNVPFKKLRF